MARVSVFLWRAYRISFSGDGYGTVYFSDDNLVCCHFYLFDLVKIGIYECYDDKTDTGVQSHCKSYAGLSFISRQMAVAAAASKMKDMNQVVHSSPIE